MLFSAADPHCYAGKYLCNLLIAGTAKQDRGILPFFDSKLVPGVTLMERLLLTVNYYTCPTLSPLFTAYIPVSRCLIYSSKDKGGNHRLCPACIINNPVTGLKPPVFLKILPFAGDCLVSGQEVVCIICYNFCHPD